MHGLFTIHSITWLERYANPHFSPMSIIANPPKRSPAPDKQCPFSCIITIGLAFVSRIRIRDRPARRRKRRMRVNVKKRMFPIRYIFTNFSSVLPSPSVFSFFSSLHLSFACLSRVSLFLSSGPSPLPGPPLQFNCPREAGERFY